jgi:hypothetical protein
MGDYSTASDDDLHGALLRLQVALLNQDVRIEDAAAGAVALAVLITGREEGNCDQSRF